MKLWEYFVYKEKKLLNKVVIFVFFAHNYLFNAHKTDSDECLHLKG